MAFRQHLLHFEAMPQGLSRKTQVLLIGKAEPFRKDTGKVGLAKSTLRTVLSWFEFLAKAAPLSTTEVLRWSLRQLDSCPQGQSPALHR